MNLIVNRFVANVCHQTNAIKTLLRLDSQLFCRSRVAPNKFALLNRKQLFHLNQVCLSKQLNTNETLKSKSDNAENVLNSKKRALRKKVKTRQTPSSAEVMAITAYSTADEYNVDLMREALRQQALYEQIVLEHIDDVLVLRAKYQVNHNQRDIFIFQEGSLVFWNVNAVERNAFLKFIKQFEVRPYEEEIVNEECEDMDFDYINNAKSKFKNGMILINQSHESSELEKYAFSNAIALSVKLAIWEASLDRYIDSIEFVSQDMKKGNKIKLTRNQVFRKTGELFALRHQINLSSDLLDTPDFYWDRQELEKLFTNIYWYLNISKRTKIMNEKLSHCVELMELLASHLNDIHHVRLEWMIIVLIMVEVIFETVHYIDNYIASEHNPG